MSETASAAPRGRGVWVARLATAVILVSLVTLMVAPAYIERRVTPERGRVERADQGRALVGLAEFDLALEMSALRGYLISGDSTFLHTYTAAQRSELALYPRLEVLLDDAAPRLRARLDDLRAAAAGWERDADAEEIVRRRRSATPIAGVSTEQAQFERALRAAAALDAALAHESELARARIRDAEQLRFVITVGLVVLSLASAAAATWFARRVRLLGREAAARRDQAERALAELQESVRARERMIRGVTHDLKNPLGAARGYAELLLDPEVAGRLGGRQPEMVGAIRRNLDGALGIIHDLLNLARAESGQLEVVRAPLDCAQLLGEAVDEYRGAAHAAGHQLELLAECDGVRVVSDGARVRQILGNLLSNAIKYTPAGGRIQVTARPQLAPQPRLRVAVEDSGPGIAPAEREAVFREFERLNAGNGVEGHGLGLAISRRMARLLGAELEVEDGALGGAAFVLTLPVEAG